MAKRLDVDRVRELDDRLAEIRAVQAAIAKEMQGVASQQELEAELQRRREYNTETARLQREAEEVARQSLVAHNRVKRLKGELLDAEAAMREMQEKVRAAFDVVGAREVLSEVDAEERLEAARTGGLEVAQKKLDALQEEVRGLEEQLEECLMRIGRSVVDSK